MFIGSVIPLKHHIRCNFAKILRHEFIPAINENCKPILLLIYGKRKFGVSHASFNCAIEGSKAILRYLK